MGATSISENGNQLSITFSDKSVAPAYFVNGYWVIGKNSVGANNLMQYGEQFVITYDNGDIQTAYQTGLGYWVLNNQDAGITVPVDPPDNPPVPPVDNSGKTVKDLILPGHHITNPGGTIASGWTWHINRTGRGGDDINYNFEEFKAPADGTVTHFDVAGVGMVVKLVLDKPAIRKNPKQAAGNDAEGPMKAIWFEHCSGNRDGHAKRGDVIGRSGDGYGAYAPHLHVHGRNDTVNDTTGNGRCCFWGFV